MISLVKRTPSIKSAIDNSPISQEMDLMEKKSTNHKHYHDIVDSKNFGDKQKTGSRKFFKPDNYNYLHSNPPLLALNPSSNKFTDFADSKTKTLDYNSKLVSLNKTSKKSKFLNSIKIPTKYSISISYKKQVF